MTASCANPALDQLYWLRSLVGRRFGSTVDLRKRLAALDLPQLEVVDCGCGLNRSVVSRQVLKLPFARLVSVDGFPAIAEMARRLPSSARRREVHCLNLSALARHFGHRRLFDVALCLDVLEHLPKPAALEFLRDLETMVRRRVVLWLPLGEYRVDADPHHRGNALELHRSFWSAEELRALGYEVEVLPKFHIARYDAAWAIKRLEASR